MTHLLRTYEEFLLVRTDFPQGSSLLACNQPVIDAMDYQCWYSNVLHQFPVVEGVANKHWSNVCPNILADCLDEAQEWSYKNQSMTWIVVCEAHCDSRPQTTSHDDDIFQWPIPH